ncbi:MAG: RHS repeat-associated core domain-containing protein [Bacteroidota bacterium]
MYRYYAHGPLARVELGTQTVQGLDYYYTLQGWLKGMNMPYNSGTNNASIHADPGHDGETGTIGKDVASFTLGYFQSDYSPINAAAPPENAELMWVQMMKQWYGSIPLLNPGAGLFNGNISWMITDLAKQGDLQSDPAKGVQAMLYRYDQLNRLTKSRSLSYDGAAFVDRSHDPAAHDAYDEDFVYDANGNLTNLKRMDQNGALKDLFEYSYYDNSNKLKSIHPIQESDLVINSGAITSDNNIYRNITIGGSAYVPSGATVELKATQGIEMDPSLNVPDDTDFWPHLIGNNGMYEYDEIGNLVRDNENGVTIAWTPAGKVKTVTKDEDGTVMSFKYDAMGNRIEKKVVKAGVTKITRYLRDGGGKVMTIYNDAVAIEYPIYGSTRVGQYVGGGQEGKIVLGQRHYEVKNHLGNILSVISDKVSMTSGNVMATALSTSDYYPFGSAMEGRTWSDPGINYRYGFNGKEKDENTGWGSTEYDYGFRIYNPEIGRFLSVDPLTSSYPWYTPYQFSGDTPIQAVDLDGREIYYSQDGNVIGSYGTSSEIRVINEDHLRMATTHLGDYRGEGSTDPQETEQYLSQTLLKSGSVFLQGLFPDGGDRCY